MAVDHPVGINVKVEVEWSSPTFTDITADVRFMTCQSSQRSRLQQTYDPGFLTLVLNNAARKYDPLYSSGAYFGNIKPGKLVRVTLDSTSATATQIFYGQLDRFVLDYDQSNNDSTCTVTAIDGLAVASLAQIGAGVTPALVDGDTVDFRIGWLRDAAGLPSSYGFTGSGSYVAECTGEWDNSRARNFLDEIRKVGDLEQGPIIANTSLVGVEPYSRHWFKELSRSNTIQTTIGAGGLPFYGLTVVFDGDEIITTVSLVAEDGSTAQATDSAAVTTYGVRTPPLSSDALPARGVEVLRGAADTIIGFRATEEFRVDELIVKPGSDSGWQQWSVDLQLLSRVTINYTPTGTGSAIAADYFIDGITHEISPGDWTTTYSLMPANRFDEAIPDDLFIIGTSLVNGTDLVGF
jgi:hypothetical protein